MKGSVDCFLNELVFCLRFVVDNGIEVVRLNCQRFFPEVFS